MASFLMGKAGIALVIAAVIAVSLAIVARNWSCRKPKPPRPPKIQSYDVASVPTGNSIEVYTGRRNKRTAVVTLSGIGIPSLEEEARAHLEGLAGKTIRVEVKRRGLLRGTEEDEAEVDDFSFDARGPIQGVVYGSMGLCLQLEMLRQGMALTVEKASHKIPAEWIKAERAAKKAGRGIWAGK